MTYTFEGLDPDSDYFFQVRAINGIKNAMQVAGTGNTPATDTRYLDYSASGRGAWARATVLVTSLKIEAPAILSLPRNATMQLSFLANIAAATETVVWTVSDSSFATVDDTGLITIKNKMGMVTLTVRDTITGVSHSIVLRIT
jgi:hypothetical protein